MTDNNIQITKPTINPDDQLTNNKHQLYRWCFTWFNYTDEDIEKLRTFAKMNCNMLVFGYETAPTTGNKHLQGYFNLKKRRTLKSLKDIFGPTPSFFKANKNDLANYRYCCKDNNFWYWESQMSNKELVKKTIKLTKAERYEKAWELARQGLLTQIDKDILLTHGKQLKTINTDYYIEQADNHFYDQPNHNYFKEFNIWLTGTTGTGKSFFVQYFIKGINKWWKNYCFKNDIPHEELKVFNKQRTKWWCGWNGEQIILIDEVDPVFCTWYATELKQWTDQYSFNAEVKGGNIGKINPWFFIITSNYKMDECFIKLNNRDPVKDINGKFIINHNDLDPMKRRFRQVTRTEENRTQLIRWPCYKNLTKYFDSLKNAEKIIDEIAEKYYNEVVENQNVDNGYILQYCQYCDEDQFKCKCYNEDEDQHCHICDGYCDCGRFEYLKNNNLGIFSKKRTLIENAFDKQSNKKQKCNEDKGKEPVKENSQESPMESDFCNTPEIHLIPSSPEEPTTSNFIPGNTNIQGLDGKDYTPKIKCIETELDFYKVQNELLFIKERIVENTTLYFNYLKNV